MKLSSEDKIILQVGSRFKATRIILEPRVIIRIFIEDGKLNMSKSHLDRLFKQGGIKLIVEKKE